MIGKELRKARLAAGLTQEQLAVNAKLHPTYVSLLERDERSPSLAVFLRLSNALKISPIDFLKLIVSGGSHRKDWI